MSILRRDGQMSNLNYMSGLFDAEGSAFISIGSKGDCIPAIAIRMNDREPLRIFARHFGGEISQYSNGVYSWSRSCRNAISVAETLHPLILIKRKQDAISCVIKCAKRLQTKRSGKPLPSYEKNLREQFRLKCKALNARGNKRLLPEGKNNLHVTHLSRIQPTLSDTEYAAGLFDGEGCATIGQGTNPTGNVIPSVEFGMCDIEPLSKLSRCFGGYLSIAKSKGNKSDYYRWRIWGAQIIPFAEMLVPYLKIHRKQKALFCVLECARTFRHENNQPIGRFLQEERERLREACCKLNSKQEAEITVTPPLQLRLF